ncbi:MAG: hypothetical protein AAGA86_15240, partial [Bacteroidota bacterium]
AFSQTPTAGELVGIHTLNQTEINNIANPILGTLVYNTDTNSLQAFSGGAWEVPQTVSTLVDNGDGTFTYTDENGHTVTVVSVGPQGPQGAQGPVGPQGPPGSPTITNLSQAMATGIITYTNEENTAQTANVISSDANNIIVPGSDGGAYRRLKLVDVYDANTAYDVDVNTFRQVQFNTTRLNEGGIFTLIDNNVRVSEGGTYEITYGVSAMTDAWTGIEAQLRVNNVEVTASNSFNGGWYKGSTATRKVYLNLNANDEVSVWVQRIDRTNNGGNNVSTIQNGSSLLINKLD